MSYQVQIIRDIPCTDPIGNLEAVVVAVLEHENTSPGDLSVVLTSDEKIRDLNLRFAQIDQATDVLAFTDGSLDPETDRIYYGDITIALPIAQQQAEQAKHSLEAELALLAIHGALHLLGYNHQEEDDRKQMWEVQAKILKKFDYSFNKSDTEA